MAQGWIEERFRRFENQRGKERLKEKYQHNASSAFPSMFEALKRQVETDVKDYNGLFSSRTGYKECWATVREESDGFRVDVGERAVKVKKTPLTTIVGLVYLGLEAGPSNQVVQHGHLELAPDEQGDLRFKSIDGDFLDVEHASEQILDPVLCG